MSGRRILLTGGAGFIGSSLLDALLAAGDEVTVVDNFNDYYDPATKRLNIAPHRDNKSLQLVEADICDQSLWQGLDSNDGWDALIHVAARAGVRPSIEQPLRYVRTNVEGTALALNWACSGRRPIPFVFASSSSVYGDANSPPYSEQNSLPAPVSPYGSSKLAAEGLLRGRAKVDSLPIAILRFFTVYGPRQRPDLAIYKFTRLIELGKSIPVFGDGTSARDYTHISDLVDGVLACLSLLLGEGLPHAIYNLGSDRSISLTEMISIIEGAVGRKARIERLPMQQGDVRCTWADLTRARRELGYEPKVDFTEGVADFVSWWRAR